MTLLVKLVRLAAVAGVVAACSQRPAHVVLQISDPDQLATEATQLAIGVNEGSDPSPTALAGKSFPLRITLVSASGAGTKHLTVEALGADGVVLGRARAQVAFEHSTPAAVAIELGVPCDADAGCSDGLHCNGEETCVDGVCIAGDDPCPPPTLVCAGVPACEEGDGTADCDPVDDNNICTFDFCGPDPAVASDTSLMHSVANPLRDGEPCDAGSCDSICSAGNCTQAICGPTVSCWWTSTSA